MSRQLTPDDVRKIAIQSNQAFSGASEYGQMIMNPQQMKNVYEKYYGGSREVSGTFADNWQAWTQPWVTGQNPDGKYIQGINNEKGEAASFYDIMRSPFSDALSIPMTFDFFSPIREGWFKGSRASEGSAAKYVQSLRKEAAEEHAKYTEYIRSRSKAISLSSYKAAKYLGVMADVVPPEYWEGLSDKVFNKIYDDIKKDVDAAEKAKQTKKLKKIKKGTP